MFFLNDSFSALIQSRAAFVTLRLRVKRTGFNVSAQIHHTPVIIYRPGNDWRQCLADSSWNVCRVYFCWRPSIGPLRCDELEPVSGWDSPHSSQRAVESDKPARRKGEDGAMDDREEEEEEEASSSCFPREDDCDTGERGDPGGARAPAREPSQRRHTKFGFLH